ncbi:MAG: FliM/FliN family flagellar motor C-terminal domain-containing protein [Paracoccus sp. (in: a-proteobacteria)]|nr:FliM/FliN family flagellar motor C-terminal domain-containing protein [Paracoccus sp. (in: a-proteobacteria)]
MTQDSTTAKTGGGGNLFRLVTARRGETTVRRAEPPPPTPRRAVALAVGRAAQDQCGMATYPGRVDLEPLTLTEMIERLPEQALLIVVEGAEERLGLVALCPSLVAAVIEQQSLGRVSPQPPRPRFPTRTDAAICAEFVNAALAEIGAEGAVTGGLSGAGGYRYASFVDDPKPLELILDDCAYAGMSLEMTVGKGGARVARLMVILPDETQDARRGDHGRVLSAPAAELPQPASLAAAVRAAPLALSAVLARQQVTLGQLRALAAGGELPLPRLALEAVRIEGADGALLMHGRLGELDGAPALRLRAASRATPAKPDSENLFSGHDEGEVVLADIAEAAPDLPLMDSATEPPMDDLTAPDPFRDEEAALPLQIAFD